MAGRWRQVWRVSIILILALLVAGCAGAGASNAAPPGANRGRTPTTAPATATARPATATRSAAGVPVRPTVAAPSSPYTIVRTYTDAQGRPVTLYHGRGVGTRGDWGWAHIIGKHLYGEWRDGGPLTTFDVVGVTSEAGVQDLIGRVLAEDRRPDEAARGRREYRLPVANTRYEVLAVVGNDGAIITAYPDTVARAGG